MSAVPPTSSPPPGAQPIWGSYSGGSHTAAPTAASAASAPSPARDSSAVSHASAWISGGEPLEPLSRRLLQAAGFLSFLLVAVLANAFINSSEENPLNPIAAAAERTQSEPGARFTMRAIYTSDALPKPMAAHGGGAFNSQTGRSRVVLRLNSPEGRVKVVTVSDGTSIFLRGTGISGEPCRC